MYTLIRKEEKKNKRYEHIFYLKEKPQILGYTNYRDTTEKYEWKVSGEHLWEWKQINRNYRILDYIPIINTVKAFCLELKYKICRDGEKIGEAFFTVFQKIKTNVIFLL